MAQSEVSLASVMLGLSALLADPRAEPEIVGGVAEHAWRQLGSRRSAQLRKEIENVQTMRAGIWVEEIDPAGITRVRARLARLIDDRIDGVTLFLLRARLQPSEAALAEMAVARAGLTAENGFSVSEVFYAAEVLAEGISVAYGHLGLGSRIGFEREDLYLEDDEVELAPDSSGRAAELPAFLSDDARSFIEKHPEADEEALAEFLRRRVRAHLRVQARTETRVRATFGDGRFDFLRAAGADATMIDGARTLADLQAELERMPASRRLDRLVLDREDEPFLLALTKRHAGLVGQTVPLSRFLTDGIARRAELIDRIVALGRLRGYAGLRARIPLEIGDFDAVEAVIRETEALVARLARRPAVEETPWVPWCGTRPDHGRLHKRDLYSLEREKIAEATDPVRRARALAILGNKVAGDVDRRWHGWRECLKEALTCWSRASEVWTPTVSPRKFAVLAYNAAVARRRAAGKEDVRSSSAVALRRLDMALAALNPELEPWCYAAIWGERQKQTAAARSDVE